MHRREAVQAALDCAADGMTPTEVGRALGIPRETVRDWIAGALPASFREPQRCSHNFATLDGSYAYLLGLYLGDGCLSAHPRDVYKLRIVLDLKYPGIIASAAAATESVRGRPALVQRRPQRELCGSDRLLEVLALSVPATRNRPEA